MHKRSKKRILVLGSTGSIGTQTLDVIRTQPDRFEVVGLSSHTNAPLLAAQAEEFGVKKILLSEGQPEALESFAETVEADLVVVALTGASGLAPTLAAIRSGKNIALANKETLVIDGANVMAEVRRHGAQLIPVDSEHSAIFQCLQTVDPASVDKIILTCSGGPFLGKKRAELEGVTVEQALNHPTWSMGKKITVDSATLMNKGFEVVEAHHLFGIDYNKIEVRIHPQSIVHGMVQLKDGNTLMSASAPDMRIPIHYALNHPERTPLPGLQESFADRTLTFSLPDHETFPGIQMVLEAARRGGDLSARLVQANDEAVADFLAGKIPFLEIYERVRQALV